MECFSFANQENKGQKCFVPRKHFPLTCFLFFAAFACKLLTFHRSTNQSFLSLSRLSLVPTPASPHPMGLILEEKEQVVASVHSKLLC